MEVKEVGRRWAREVRGDRARVVDGAGGIVPLYLGEVEMAAELGKWLM